MADSFTQVAPDSTGDKIDASELTVGTNTVNRQRVVLADDATAAGLGKLLNAAPAGTEYGLVTRPIPSGTQAVSGTFWQATQPVSGPLTDTQLRATAVPVTQTTLPAGTNIIGAVRPHPATTHRNLFTASAGIVAGATATAALVSVQLGGMTGAAPSGAATTLGLANGARLRFTQITIVLRGHATATTAALAVRLVVNTAGAVAATSNIQAEWAVATAATAAATEVLTINPPEGFELVGSGATFNYGFVVVPTFVTNAPTFWISANAYEYT